MFWKIIIGMIQVPEMIKLGQGWWGQHQRLHRSMMCLEEQLLFSLIHCCHGRLCVTKSSALDFCLFRVFVFVCFVYFGVLFFFF